MADRGVKDLTTSKLYVKKVPRSLHRAFGAWCKLRGVSIQDKIISLMRETVKQTEGVR